MAAIPDPWKTLKGGATAGEDAGRRQRLSASSRDEKLRRGKRADFSNPKGNGRRGLQNQWLRYRIRGRL
jgi:hypothetical protein